jgi:hypothetical protein
VPVLGSGRIFPVPEEEIACDRRREFPEHWPRIGGMDFGYDHPFAAVELVWDRDTDTVYVTRTFRHREGSPVLHAAALRPWGKLPWAWPRDGRTARRSRAQAWRSPGNTARKASTCCLSTRSSRTAACRVEAGLMDMLDRMQTGRFKVLRISTTGGRNSGCITARTARWSKRATT